MQYITVILGALSTLVALTTGSAIGAIDPSLNASVAEWTGLSNGANVTLFGTATEIAAQLKALDPSWTPAPPLNFTADRHGEYQGDILCCPVAAWGWGPVDYETMKLAIDATNALGSGGYLVRANDCYVVECTDGVAGIWVCNNDPVNSVAVDYSWIGAYALNVANNCPSIGREGTDIENCGQTFDIGSSFNVIIHACSA